MDRADLPKGWESIPLGDERVCLDIQPGFACGKKDIRGGIPHLRMNNISSDGQSNFSLVRRIPKEIAEKNKKWLEPEDVIFCNTNSTELVGKSCLFSGWNEKCTFSNHLTRLRVNRKYVIPQWLLFSLQELWLEGYFATNCTEFIGQSAFNKDKLCEVEILIPPLPEQQRIVARIEALTKRLNQARQFRQQALGEAAFTMAAYLQKLVKESEKKGWEQVQLSDRDVCQIVMGQSPPGASYNFDKKGAPLLNGPTEFGAIHPTPVQWTIEPTRFCQKDDILFCVRGSTTGRMNWADQTYCLGRGLAAIRPNTKRFVPAFVFATIQVQVAAILHRAEGGVFPNFNKDQLQALQIPEPTKPEQERIAEILQSLQSRTDELHKLQTEVDTELDSFLPALLAKAFRGEL